VTWFRRLLKKEKKIEVVYPGRKEEAAFNKNPNLLRNIQKLVFQKNHNISLSFGIAFVTQDHV